MSIYFHKIKYNTYISKINNYNTNDTNDNLFDINMIVDTESNITMGMLICKLYGWLINKELYKSRPKISSHNIDYAKLVFNHNTNKSLKNIDKNHLMNIFNNEINNIDFTKHDINNYSIIHYFIIYQLYDQLNYIINNMNLSYEQISNYLELNNHQNHINVCFFVNDFIDIDFSILNYKYSNDLIKICKNNIDSRSDSESDYKSNIESNLTYDDICNQYKENIIDDENIINMFLYNTLYSETYLINNEFFDYKFIIKKNKKLMMKIFKLFVNKYPELLWNIIIKNNSDFLMLICKNNEFEDIITNNAIKLIDNSSISNILNLYFKDNINFSCKIPIIKYSDQTYYDTCYKESCNVKDLPIHDINKFKTYYQYLIYLNKWDTLLKIINLIDPESIIYIEKWNKNVSILQLIAHNVVFKYSTEYYKFSELSLTASSIVNGNYKHHFKNIIELNKNVKNCYDKYKTSIKAIFKHLLYKIDFLEKIKTINTDNENSVQNEYIDLFKNDYDKSIIQIILNFKFYDLIECYFEYYFISKKNSIWLNNNLTLIYEIIRFNWETDDNLFDILNLLLKYNYDLNGKKIFHRLNKEMICDEINIIYTLYALIYSYHLHVKNNFNMKKFTDFIINKFNFDIFENKNKNFEGTYDLICKNYNFFYDIFDHIPSNKYNYVVNCIQANINEIIIDKWNTEGEKFIEIFIKLMKKNKKSRKLCFDITLMSISEPEDNYKKIPFIKKCFEKMIEYSSKNESELYVKNIILECNTDEPIFFDEYDDKKYIDNISNFKQTNSHTCSILNIINVSLLKHNKNTITPDIINIIIDENKNKNANLDSYLFLHYLINNDIIHQYIDPEITLCDFMYNICKIFKYDMFYYLIRYIKNKNNIIHQIINKLYDDNILFWEYFCESIFDQIENSMGNRQTQYKKIRNLTILSKSIKHLIEFMNKYNIDIFNPRSTKYGSFIKILLKHYITLSLKLKYNMEYINVRHTISNKMTLILYEIINKIKLIHLNGIFDKFKVNSETFSYYNVICKLISSNIRIYNSFLNKIIHNVDAKLIIKNDYNVFIKFIMDEPINNIINLLENKTEIFYINLNKHEQKSSDLDMTYCYIYNMYAITVFDYFIYIRHHNLNIYSLIKIFNILMDYDPDLFKKPQYEDLKIYSGINKHLKQSLMSKYITNLLQIFKYDDLLSFFNNVNKKRNIFDILNEIDYSDGKMINYFDSLLINKHTDIISDIYDNNKRIVNKYINITTNKLSLYIDSESITDKNKIIVDYFSNKKYNLDLNIGLLFIGYCNNKPYRSDYISSINTKLINKIKYDTKFTKYYPPLLIVILNNNLTNTELNSRPNGNLYDDILINNFKDNGFNKNMKIYNIYNTNTNTNNMINIIDFLLINESSNRIIDYLVCNQIDKNILSHNLMDNIPIWLYLITHYKISISRIFGINESEDNLIKVDFKNNDNYKIIFDYINSSEDVNAIEHHNNGFIDYLKQNDIDIDKFNMRCMICFDDFTENNDIIKCPQCGHSNNGIFHASCLAQWMTTSHQQYGIYAVRSRQCPHCKVDMTAESESINKLHNDIIGDVRITNTRRRRSNIY